jgi:hypothetical protein
VWNVGLSNPACGETGVRARSGTAGRPNQMLVGAQGGLCNALTGYWPNQAIGGQALPGIKSFDLALLYRLIASGSCPLARIPRSIAAITASTTATRAQRLLSPGTTVHRAQS